VVFDLGVKPEDWKETLVISVSQSSLQSFSVRQSVYFGAIFSPATHFLFFFGLGFRLLTYRLTESQISNGPLHLPVAFYNFTVTATRRESGIRIHLRHLDVVQGLSFWVAMLCVFRDGRKRDGYNVQVAVRLCGGSVGYRTS
jgi:hypothetical protein